MLDKARTSRKGFFAAAAANKMTAAERGITWAQ